MKIIALAALALLGAGIAGVLAHASSTSKAQTVNVTLKDYSIGLSTRKLKAGTVHFVVENKGPHTHGFDISGPGVAKAKLKSLLKPGKSATLSVTVKSGRYSAWCPVPGHVAKGMKATLTASGGSGAPPTTTSGTTTGGGAGWG
jgi:plastocyanin